MTCSGTRHIIITGEESDLRPRLPEKYENTKLEWKTVSVLKYEALTVSEELMNSIESKPFDWLLFTSPRAIRFWSHQVLNHGIEFPVHTKVACMGKRSAQIADMEGFTADFIPDNPGTEGFLEDFEKTLAPGSQVRILIPMAQQGRIDIRHELEAKGHEVLTVPFYKTLPKSDIRSALTDEWLERADLILFTSPSSVDAFKSAFEIPANTPVACLGQFTSDHLKELGFENPRILPKADLQRVGEILC